MTDILSDPNDPICWYFLNLWNAVIIYHFFRKKLSFFIILWMLWSFLYAYKSISQPRYAWYCVFYMLNFYKTLKSSLRTLKFHSIFRLCGIFLFQTLNGEVVPSTCLRIIYKLKNIILVMLNSISMNVVKGFKMG